MSGGGRLSIVKNPMSSKQRRTDDFPAPEIPVMITIWGVSDVNALLLKNEI